IIFIDCATMLNYSSELNKQNTQVPRVLDSNILKPLNKGNIYISKTSPRSVLDAYLSQFKRDFSLFLKSRTEEMVVDGHMVLSFMGRLSADPSSEESCMRWERLSQVLVEEKTDSFNAPYYAPSAQEVRSVVEEVSFTINCLEAFELDWDGGGQQAAKTIRAVIESVLEVHFGREIMDELFKRYAQEVGDYFSRTSAKYIDLWRVECGSGGGYLWWWSVEAMVSAGSLWWCCSVEAAVVFSLRRRGVVVAVVGGGCYDSHLVASGYKRCAANCQNVD
ncbi:jasmonate O-methyltransferase, partial [Olea europaea subsp. europaea]